MELSIKQLKKWFEVSKLYAWSRRRSKYFYDFNETSIKHRGKANICLGYIIQSQPNNKNKC